MLWGMYDPFARGPHPVGVLSRELVDASRAGRVVPLEIWYPASDAHAGRDLDRAHQDVYPIFGGHQVRQEALRDAQPQTGPLSVVLFSHGFAGHRRQSTFFCTHLASHGFAVVAMDHGGNTLQDIVQLALDPKRGAALGTMQQTLSAFVADRPHDVRFVLGELVSGRVGLPFVVETERVGMSGHSFGGFTTLVVAEQEPRIVAALPLAPAGGPGPLSAPALEEALTLRFEGRVETLYLALERDTLLPLSGIESLFRRTPEPSRMLVLRNADHMHFCDRVERSHEFFRVMPQVGAMRDVQRRLPKMSELVPGAHGHAFASGFGTLLFDAVLRHGDESRARLAEDPVACMRARGIEIDEVGRLKA
jgi:dienelactone hydrolase